MIRFILFSSFALAANFASAASVTVAGTCLRSTPPDRGSVTVTVVNQDNDVKKATQKTSVGYEALKKAVLKLNLKDSEVSTSEYNVSEVREWTNNKSILKGYSARMGLMVSTSEISRLGEVMDIASKQNLHEVGGLTMFLSPEKYQTERDLCLEEAVKNAKTKAEHMATAAGMKLDGIAWMKDSDSESIDNPRPPGPMMAMDLAGGRMEKSSAPSVDAANAKITVQVHVQYSLK